MNRQPEESPTEKINDDGKRRRGTSGVRKLRRARTSTKVAGESKLARRMRRGNAMKQRKQVVATKEQSDAINARMAADAKAYADEQRSPYDSRDAMVSPSAMPGDAPPTAITSVLGIADDGKVES